MNKSIFLIGFNMTRIVVVTSGKGGVGKTTTSASFSTGLALKGYKTVVIDFDIGLRNLDLLMGCERRVVYDFINVINGESNLYQSLIQDKNIENLFILPASQTKDKSSLTIKSVEKIINELKNMDFKYIIFDSPAGIESGALIPIYFADDALLVTNPEVSSVRDSDKMLGILSSKSRRSINNDIPVKKYLLITRYNPKLVYKGEMMSLSDVENILRIKMIGVIPESNLALHASNRGLPVIRLNNSEISESYKDVVSRFLGEIKPLRFINYKKNSFIKRIFKGV